MSEDIEKMITDVIDADPTLESPEAAKVAVEVIQSARPLFEDDEMLGLCAEILTNMRGDRKQLDSLISNFVEMVFNEGDSTTASKEAMVALMVAKTNMSDKMMSIVEIMTKVKLKEMANNPTKAITQETHYHLGTRRSFIEQIEKHQKKKKVDKEEKK